MEKLRVNYIIKAKADTLLNLGKPSRQVKNPKLGLTHNLGGIPDAAIWRQHILYEGSSSEGRNSHGHLPLSLAICPATACWSDYSYGIPHDCPLVTWTAV